MLPALGSLLLNVGSFALRKMADKKTGNSKMALEQVANIVDYQQGKLKGDAVKDIDSSIQKLPADMQTELYQHMKEMEELAIEREKNQQDHDLGLYTEDQKTQRVEYQHGTDYGKNTRPWCARQSFKGGCWYVGGLEFIESMSTALGKTVPGADWEIALLIFSPCLGYMGVRTIDAFSKWKTAPLSVLNKLKPNR